MSFGLLYTKLSTRCIVSFLYLNVRATSSELADFEVLLKPNLFASLKVFGNCFFYLRENYC